MRYWWVNQNQTYRHEVPGGYLWSPVTRADGVRNYFYDTMTEVQPGDVIYSFSDTFIKAVGIATSAAEPSVKPDFGGAGDSWANYGWLVQVEFQELDKPIRPKDHMAVLAPLLPSKYAPLQANGNGLQGVYLTELPLRLASALDAMVGEQAQLTANDVLAKPDPLSLLEVELESLIGRVDLPATEKRQLINARVGQGLFRNNVRLNEQACRVTGVRQLHHLRASHIKPWRESSDVEKLHGCNGLLLAPHVDHLFDRGFISFEGDGSLIVSEAMEPEVLDAWGIAELQAPRAFNVDQRHFLEFHRSQVLIA
ncbi:MAG: HNH endonuclease [Frankiales bacterium]|nr:HNH endonuclease [Frankiales bacterium]